MSYSAQNIRNICLLGHSGVGKTMLVESMLNLTGATDRLGKTADGNTGLRLRRRGDQAPDFHFHRPGSRGVQGLQDQRAGHTGQLRL